MVGLALFLVAQQGVRAAEPLDVVSAEGGVVSHCEDDPKAACWSNAFRLQRFAPRAGLFAPVVYIDVRLAMDQGVLLVRAADLSPGLVLDLYLRKNVGVAEHLRIDGTADPDPHVARFTLESPLKIGEERSLTAELRNRDAVLAWGPAGEVGRAASLLFVPNRAHHDRPVVSLGAGHVLTVQAPGADITVTEDREVSRDATAWSATGKDRVDATAPAEGGFLTVRTAWKESGKGDLAVWRIWCPSVGAPALTMGGGIHPAPRIQVPGQGQFALRDGMAIHYDDRTHERAASLLADELLRMQGRSVRVTQGGARAGDIWVGGDGSVARSLGIEGEAAQLARKEGGFAIAVRDKTLAVLASTTTGATYGVLAVADLLADDGTTPAAVLADAPDLARRLLHWDLAHNRKKPLQLSDMRALLHKAILRGRYNELVLEVGGGYRFPSHPELARSNQLDEATLGAFILEARAYGLQVSPLLDTPAHAEWIIESKGSHLREDNSGSLLCTRHPALHPLLADLYRDLIKVFGHPETFHIGLDEAMWPGAVGADERCARCAGTPRWRLLADHILWNLDTLKAQGVTEVMAWSDMLVAGWHGGGGTSYAAEVIPPDRRKELTLLPWTPRGDSIGSLVPLGYRVFHGQTGYVDANRRDLTQYLDVIAGEAFAMFNAHPWDAWGGASDEASLSTYWPNVILAGATAWRPELAATPVQVLLDAVRSHPAYRPGWHGDPTHAEALAPRGAPGPEGGPALLGPLTVAGLTYPRATWLAARPGHPIDLGARGSMTGLSIVEAARVEHDRELALAQEFKNTGDPPLIANLHVVLADGSDLVVPLRYGRETYRYDRGRATLWDAAGSITVPSGTARASSSRAGDQVLYRYDVPLGPEPVVVRSARLEVADGGVELVVAAAAAFR